MLRSACQVPGRSRADVLTQVSQCPLPDSFHGVEMEESSKLSQYNLEFYK